ncbi:MAG: LppX_LprAFG lipoprotein [Nocardioidaceae bacterium]
MLTRTRSRFLVLTAAAAATVTLAACSGSGAEEDRSPEEVLTEAKTTLDETSGVHVVLSTEKLPPSVDGILKAEGVGTHAPAFQGDLTVAAGGITADAAVVAVDGTVYAKLPFTTNFTEIDPADYGAPDPAALMESEGGLSSLLTAAEDVKQGKAVRDQDQVLTTYTGTVPGDVVAGIIPSASAGSDFDARFTVSGDGVLDTAELTGPFYPKVDDVTYTIEFDQYDLSREITAPEETSAQ